MLSFNNYTHKLLRIEGCKYQIRNRKNETKYSPSEVITYKFNNIIELQNYLNQNNSKVKII